MKAVLCWLRLGSPAGIPVAASLLAVVAVVACASAPQPKQDVLGKSELGKEELARLRRDILKVDKSIEVTRELINRSKGERYLPDLYFRLAELYIEKSRVVYFRILEEAGADDKTAVVAPEARLLKDQAIAVYRRVLGEFPEYVDNDKITFFIAHEYRELGNFQEMTKTYEELVRKYPKSNFRFESWLILGDYHFDRGDIDQAVESYRAILKNPETYAHNMARYKLAWCYVNKDKVNLAVDLWEQAVRTPTLPEPGLEVLDTLAERPARLDVRQDALRDLAYYYAEAREPRSALDFFQNLTVSRAEYKMALEKLARRFQIKTMYEESARVYRELIRISHDVDRNLEWAEAVYEAAVAARDLSHADEDVMMLSEVAARYKFWWRAPDEDKLVLQDFELLTRDLSTRLHALAKERNDDDLYRRAARAYESYLSVFDDASERLNMEWNYADTLFAGKRYVKAGRQYEKVLALLGETSAPPPSKTSAPAPPKKEEPNKGKDGKKRPQGPAPGARLGAAAGDLEGDRKQATYSAILSYFEALKVEEKGTRFDSMMAREGIKDLGSRFVSRFPDDPNTPTVKFNVARAYFEQGLFERAIELFTAFATEHPTSKDAVTAGELALDAYAQKEDFGGLTKAARAFAADNRMDSSFRERASKMAEQAEQEEINRKTIAAEGNVSQALASFVVEKKGSEVAAKALAQAFVIAKDRRSVQDMQSVGRQLLEEYGNTKYARDVLPALADHAVRVSQLEQAAAHYEEYARRYPDGEAADDLLENAAQIRLQLGEFAAAMADFERLAKQGDDSRRANWIAELAKTAAQAGDWRRADDAAASLVDGPHAVLSGTIAGEAAMRTGKLDVATERLSAAINGGGRGKGNADGPEWLAKAQYLLGEVVRADYERVQLKGNADDGAALQQKFQLLAELEASYVSAIQVGDPEWAMGGLYRIASAYRHMAEFLDTAPAPQGITAADEKAYRAALSERSAPMQKKSQEALDACRTQARKLEAFNRFAKACASGANVDEDADKPRARPTGVVVPGREQLEQRLIENPKDVTTLTQLMRAAIGVKDYPLARLLALRALEIDDNSAELNNLHGVASYGANDAQSAADAFKKALRSNGRHGPSLHNLGVLYSAFGDDAKAKEYFQKAGGQDSSSPDVLPRGGLR